MRNLKKVLSLALAMVMLIGMMVVGASATTFSDDADIKNQEAVDVVSGIGILTGIGDGSFNPKGTLSRAEAAVVIAKLDLGAAFGNLETTNAATFDDVGPNHWGKAYIDYCAARGLIAGDGKGKFMPDDKVTGVEFGLMVSRVLGYEDANEDVSGVNWTVKAAALARKAGLTKDVILTDTAISRDDMAQVAYNALQADLVEYDGRAITIGDVVIPAGKATPVQHKDTNYPHYTYNTTSTLDPNVQLCEEKFPNLRLSKDTSDANGRPSNVWTYGTNNVISSVAHEATFEIKDGFRGAKLASTVGKAPLGNNYAWYWYIDGELQTAANKSGSTMRADARANGTATAYAGTGATTYIYVDDTEGKASVTVCVINVYGGEVTKVTDTNVTVNDLTFATTAFEEDDVVLYTKGRDTSNGKEIIVTMEAAEKVEGSLAKVTSDTSFVVDGTTYKYNCTVEAADKMVVDNVKSNVVFYVDHDGNMVYRGDVIANVDYAYVDKINMTKSALGDDVCYARLVKTDGNVIEVSVNNVAKWADTTAAQNAVQGRIVSYTESGGKYILDARGDKTTGIFTADQLSISQGVSQIKLGVKNGSVQVSYANDDTVFLVKNADNTYSVYKGYKNVPSIKGNNSGTDATAWYNRPGTNQTLVAFISGAEIDTSDSDDIIFVVGNASSKRIGENNGTQYYEFDAVENDEVTTIKVAADTPLATALLKNNTVLTFRALKTNSKGLVTEGVDHAYAPEGYVTSTSKISSSVIGFGSATYGYTDTTRIVKLDLAGDITVGNANLVKNDTNDKVWVVKNPSGKLLSAFIMEVAKGEGTATEDTTVGNDETTVNNITVVTPKAWGVSSVNARIVSGSVRVSFNVANIADSSSFDATLSSAGFELTTGGTKSITEGKVSYNSGGTYYADEYYTVTFADNTSTNYKVNWSGVTADTGSTTNLNKNTGNALTLKMKAADLTAYQDKVSFTFKVEGADLTNAVRNNTKVENFDRTTGVGTVTGLAKGDLTGGLTLLSSGVKAKGTGAVTVTISDMTDASTTVGFTFKLAEESKKYATMDDVTGTVAVGDTSITGQSLTINTKSTISEYTVSYTVSDGTSNTGKAQTGLSSSSVTSSALDIKAAKMGSPITVTVTITPTEYTSNRVLFDGDNNTLREVKFDGSRKVKAIAITGFTASKHYYLEAGEGCTVVEDSVITTGSGSVTMTAGTITASEDALLNNDTITVKATEVFEITGASAVTGTSAGAYSVETTIKAVDGEIALPGSTTGKFYVSADAKLTVTMTWTGTNITGNTGDTLSVTLNGGAKGSAVFASGTFDATAEPVVETVDVTGFTGDHTIAVAGTNA